MEKSIPTLLFIPDISGFTKFMSEADPSFSNQVIPSLLNKIIYSNTIGLKVSEIEGDAIFFFKFGELPDLKELVHQCKHFYSKFYEQIYSLQKESSSKDSDQLDKDLGLKIIIHYGDQVESVQIGNRIKLMGEGVIAAHKLLKNKIDLSEYLLISEELLNNYPDDTLEKLADWSTWKSGTSKYPHIGTIKYRYINLKPIIEQS